MRDLQINLSHSFEVTFDDDSLFVGFTFFDDSDVSPVQVGPVISGYNFKGNSYRAKFTPTEEKQYLVHKAVYTDGTLTVIDIDEPQGSDAFRGVDVASLVLDVPAALHNIPGSIGAAIGSGGGTATDLVGILLGNQITGVLTPEDGLLVGVLSC